MLTSALAIKMPMKPALQFHKASAGSDALTLFFDKFITVEVLARRSPSQMVRTMCHNFSKAALPGISIAGEHANCNGISHRRLPDLRAYVNDFSLM